MELTEDGFVGMTRRLRAIADTHCGGRCAAILEGGYDLDALRGSVLAVLREMRGLAEEVGA